MCKVELPEKETESASLCEVEHEEDGKSHYAQPYVVDDDTTANVVVSTLMNPQYILLMTLI